MAVFATHSEAIQAKLITSGKLEEPEAGAPGPFLQWLEDLFKQLLPLLVNCIPKAQRTPEAVASVLATPNARQRRGMRFTIRQNIDDPRAGNVSVYDAEDAITSTFAEQPPTAEQTKAAMAQAS